MSHQVTDADPASPDASPGLHPGAPAWLGDLLAAVLIVAAAFLPFPGQQFQPTGPAATALVITSAAVLPLRRRWPVPALVACLALFGATACLGTLSPGIGLALGVAMFGVANRSSRRRTLLVGGITVVLVLLLSLPAELGNLFDPGVLQFALAVAFAAAAGDGARSRRAYVDAITERAERAERTRETEAQRRVSEERLRIARDLHDTVAHQIAVISLNAGVATSALDTSPDRARTALSTIRGASRTVLKEIGDLLALLRADEPDTPPAPQRGLEHLDTLLDHFAASGLDVQTRVDADLARVTGAADLVAYRLIQESLTNAHKHGGEHRARLLLQDTADTLRIVVTNPLPVGDGARRDVLEPSVGSGVGLLGVRERVASVRGTVSAGPAPGGWKVTASIPLPKENTP